MIFNWFLSFCCVIERCATNCVALSNWLGRLAGWVLFVSNMCWFWVYGRVRNQMVLVKVGSRQSKSILHWWHCGYSTFAIAPVSWPEFEVQGSVFTRALREVYTLQCQSHIYVICPHAIELDQTLPSCPRSDGYTQFNSRNKNHSILLEIYLKCFQYQCESMQLYKYFLLRPPYTIIPCHFIFSHRLITWTYYV